MHIFNCLLGHPIWMSFRSPHVQCIQNGIIILLHKQPPSSPCSLVSNKHHFISLLKPSITYFPFLVLNELVLTVIPYIFFSLPFSLSSILHPHTDQQHPFPGILQYFPKWSPGFQNCPLAIGIGVRNVSSYFFLASLLFLPSGTYD